MPCSNDARALLARLPDREDGPDAGRLLDARAALSAAWERALSDGDAQVGPLARALDRVYVRVGPEATHRRVLEDTLRSPALLPPDRHRLLLALARVHVLRGRHRTALGIVEGARQEGDPRGESALLLAVCLRALGRLDEARFEADRARFHPEPDRRAAGEVAFGAVALTEGRWVEAAAAFGRAAAGARLADAPRVEGIAETNLALTALAAGDPEAAGAALARARLRLTAAADPYHLARLPLVEGERLRRLGALDAAEAHLSAATTAAEADGDVDFALAAREGLVEVALGRGDAARAAHHIGALVARVAAAEDPRWPARVETLRARVETGTGGTRTLRLDRDARWVRLDERSLDFSRRGPLRRVLLALAAAGGRSLGVAELLAAGWPDERPTPGSGEARVYMAVRRLRALGLDGVLITRDDGYRLAPHCRVEVDGCEGM